MYSPYPRRECQSVANVLKPTVGVAWIRPQRRKLVEISVIRIKEMNEHKSFCTKFIDDQTFIKTCIDA